MRYLKIQPLARAVGKIARIGVYLLVLPAKAQLGGSQSFSFLLLPSGAQIVGLGSVQVAPSDAEATAWLGNAALNTKASHQRVSLQLQSLSRQGWQTVVGYTSPMGNNRQIGMGLQYIGYGQFEGYDLTGAPTGNFTAAEYALAFNYSHQIAPFTVGANLKIAGSSIAHFSAVAALIDAGAIFQHPQKDLRAGVSIRNMGFAVSNYTDASEWIMPFDAQIGMSFKPEQMPFRFLLTAWQLFPRPGIVQGGSLPNWNQNAFMERFTRRLVAGVQVVVHRALQLNLGYNVLYRRELSLPQRRALSGFSLGFNFRLKNWQVAYGYQVRHVAGGVSSLGITTHLTKKVRQRMEVD
ncbi:MAG: type IX secretion system protein PorQ [Cytophagales bacterium]|nr:type IX secretion system protein PorQ [Bernardetiaceae bacterium]MDW8210992.1 type IX secretion system protein PorQ [Cytophagales bacterium]